MAKRQQADFEKFNAAFERKLLRPYLERDQALKRQERKVHTYFVG